MYSDMPPLVDHHTPVSNNRYAHGCHPLQNRQIAPRAGRTVNMCHLGPCRTASSATAWVWSNARFPMGSHSSYGYLGRSLADCFAHTSDPKWLSWFCGLWSPTTDTLLWPEPTDNSVRLFECTTNHSRMVWAGYRAEKGAEAFLQGA